MSTDRYELIDPELTLNNDGAMHVGGWPGFSGQRRGFSTRVDELAIWKKRASPSFIEGLYRQGKPEAQ